MRPARKPVTQRVGPINRLAGTALRVTVQVTPPPRGAVPWFARWIAESLPPDATVLDIGAGEGLSGPLRRVRRRAGRLIGIDPSPRVHQNRQLDECFQESLEKFAPRHPDEFDLAFSVFVLEHVAHPVEFAQACARVLKPGGVLMGLTVNKWHYFGLVTWATTRLGISEWLLHRIRDDTTIGRYHYPTEYRFNTVRTVSRLLADAGFSQVEFRMWDLPEMYTPYLPAPVAGLAATWHRAVYRLSRPQLMGHLSFKATL